MFKGFPPFQSRAFLTLCGAEGTVRSTSPSSFSIASRLKLVDYSSSEEDIEDVKDYDDIGDLDEESIELCVNPCRHHPTSSKNALVDESAHIKDLHTLADDLNSALQGVFPIRETPYRRVLTLLICWKDNDVGFVGRVERLGRAFDSFNYETHLYCIPQENSYNKLEQKLVWAKNEIDKGDLLILYYGGHGVRIIPLC
jgi:hypothetical protein